MRCLTVVPSTSRLAHKARRERSSRRGLGLGVACSAEGGRDSARQVLSTVQARTHFRCVGRAETDNEARTHMRRAACARRRIPRNRLGMKLKPRLVLSLGMLALLGAFAGPGGVDARSTAGCPGDFVLASF